MISDSIGHPEVASHLPGASAAARRSGPGYAGMLGAAALAFLIAFQISKVPFYWNLVAEAPMSNTTYDEGRCTANTTKLLRPCHGLEVSENMHSLFGLRSYKLLADPLMFLAPHTIMGCTLLAILALVLLRRVSMFQAAIPYFALLTVLVLHLWPVRQGIPAPQLNGDPNTYAGLGALCMAALGGFAVYRKNEDLLNYAFVVSAGILFIPIVVEMNILLWQLGARMRYGRWPYVEGDRPSPEFGRDFYARHFSHWVGWLLNLAVIGGVTGILLHLGMRETVTGLAGKVYHRVGHQ